MARPRIGRADRLAALRAQLEAEGALGLPPGWPAVIGSVLLLLVGCQTATPMIWERPGASAAEFRRDDYLCAEQATPTWGTIPAGPFRYAAYARCMEAHGYVGRPPRAEEIPPR